MQIFVTFNKSASRTITLADRSTCAAALPLLLAQFNLTPSAHDNPTVLNAQNSLPVHPGQVLQNEASYVLVYRPTAAPRIDDEVLLLLKIRLERQLAHPGPRHMTFISTGSHINGEKGSEEAARQQCPGDVIKYCQSESLDLTIILLDQGFIDRHQGGQIYDYDKDWQESPPHLLGGRIRHFRHAKTGYRLSTYQSQFPNWLDVSDRLADISLAPIGAVINRSGGQLLVRAWTGAITYNSQPEIRLGQYQ